MKVISILFFSCLFLSLHAQDILPRDTLILSDSLVFLGMDFSQARMINPEDIDKAALIRDKHGPYWGIIDDFICKNSNLKFDFKKKHVFCFATIFDSSYTLLDSGWIVSKYDGTTDSQMAAHIKTYPPVAGYKLGVVFIIDKMDKTKNALTMYAAYIDLRTNTLLKTIKCTGTPDGFGYGMYWANAVDNAYAYFKIANGNYIQRLKRFSKRHPKV